MTTPRVTEALAIVDLLKAASIKATIDPAKISGNLPGVLLTPPRLGNFRETTWRALAIASTPNQLNAWKELDVLVDQVAAVLPVELAEPATYSTDPQGAPLPAYVLTFTTD